SNADECYICSYPFTMICYERITNNFSGELFKSVCEVELFDERSFEHEFFLRIAQSFPFMKKLTLINSKPQNEKQCRKLKHNNDDLLIIEYPHLGLAKKTAAAIVREGPPPTVNNGPSIQPALPQLPRYRPPPPPPSPPRRTYDDEMECRMFFPTSGHMGFDTVKSSQELPPIEIIREMILYETRLRLSASIQKIMDEYHTDGCAVTYVHNLIQQHVVEHFGYRDLNALRTALFRFPDDPIVQAAFYGKSLEKNSS
ncbi:unnamed protein product, partial [Rotaria sp. Silwood2]